VYDGKILLNDLNFRKILYNLLLNNVKHVLIVNNLLNWSTKIEKQELFDAKFISDLEDFLNASCITVIDYLIIVKNKVYSFKQQK
jgi:DNA repair protein RadC